MSVIEGVLCWQTSTLYLHKQSAGVTDIPAVRVILLEIIALEISC